jgi:hypothetical protein
MAHLIDGGAPAGMFIMPCASGDRTKSIMIIMITRHGNRSTRPSGIETDELPLSRIRRRKKDNRGEVFSVWRERSSKFSRLSFEVGSLLVISCRNPMVVPWWSRVVNKLAQPMAVLQLFLLQRVRREVDAGASLWGKTLKCDERREERATCLTQGA